MVTAKASYQAADECIRTCESRGRRLASMLMGNSADGEDVFQDACVVATRRFKQIPTDDPWPWFRAVIVNVARNAQRKRRPEGFHGMDSHVVAEVQSDPLLHAIRTETSHEVQQSLDALPEDERRAVVLTKLSGLTHSAAARLLNLPLGTLNSHVRRGMERMRGALSGTRKAWVVTPWVLLRGDSGTTTFTTTGATGASAGGSMVQGLIGGLVLNKMAAIVLGVLVGAGLGVFGGYGMAGGLEPDKPEPNAAGEVATEQPELETKPVDTGEIERLRGEVSDYREAVASLKTERDELADDRRKLRNRVAVLLDGPTKPEPKAEGDPDRHTELDAEQIEQKRTEIKARLEQGWENKDGRAVLDALHEMETLGPSVYDELMKEWIRLDEDHTATNELGIDKYTWRREWGGSTELLRASIDDPGSPVRFRYTAVRMLPEREAPLSTAEYLSEKLLEERDEHAIMQMAEILGTVGDPVAIDALIKVVRRHFERFYAKRTVVTALGKFDDPRTIDELKIIAANENEHQAVRAAAESALLHIAPPVSGLLITGVSPGANGAKAGLKTGDILTKLNGERITSSEAMHFGAGGELKFEVFSEGAFKDVTVDPGALGIEYEFVKAKS